MRTAPFLIIFGVLVTLSSCNKSEEDITHNSTSQPEGFRVASRKTISENDTMDMIYSYTHGKLSTTYFSHSNPSYSDGHLKYQYQDGDVVASMYTNGSLTPSAFAEYKGNGSYYHTVIQKSYYGNTLKITQSEQLTVSGDSIIEYQINLSNMNGLEPHQRLVAVEAGTNELAFVQYRRVVSGDPLEKRDSIVYIYEDNKLLQADSYSRTAGQWNLSSSMIYTYIGEFPQSAVIYGDQTQEYEYEFDEHGNLSRLTYFIDGAFNYESQYVYEAGSGNEASLHSIWQAALTYPSAFPLSYGIYKN